MGAGHSVCLAPEIAFNLFLYYLFDRFDSGNGFAEVGWLTSFCILHDVFWVQVGWAFFALMPSTIFQACACMAVGLKLNCPQGMSRSISWGQGSGDSMS